MAVDLAFADSDVGGGWHSFGMDTTADLLQRARNALAEIAQRPVLSLDDAALCALVRDVEEVGRFVDTLRAVSAAEVDIRSAYGFGADGLAQRHGHARGVDLIEHLTRVSKAEARRRVTVGSAVLPAIHLNGQQALEVRPVVAGAMTTGQLGVEAVSAICRALSDASRTASAEDLARAETELVAAAAVEPADAIRQHAIIWREYLDPDGVEPREDRAYRKRGIRVGRDIDGVSTATVTLEAVGRAKLLAIFDDACGPRIQPRYLNDPDTGTGTCTGTEAGVQGSDGATRATDPRSREQKQYDALFGILTAGLRHPDTAPTRSVAAVTAVIHLHDLQNQAGAGWMDRVTEPVSARTIEQLICDNGYETLLLGAHGRILNHGRKVEMFTLAQRRALAVRDGGCVWPGCDVPPGWCEAHHVRERSRHGPTDIDNGTLLCAAHHHLLHNSNHRMRMIEGIPHLLEPPWLDPTQSWQPLGKPHLATLTALRRTRG